MLAEVYGARTSVIMPVRNGSEFVEAAILSTLTQLATADEIIVIDDQSNDNTRQVIANIQDSRIRLLEGPGRGPASARNVGLRAAEGQLIAFLDHDDLWPQPRHALLSAILMNNPAVDATFGRLRLRCEPGALISKRIANLERKHVPIVSIGTGLFRKSILERVHGFDERMHFGEDVDYHLRLLEEGMQIALCGTDALIYRRHTGNMSNDALGMQNGMNEVLIRRIARRRKRVHNSQQ